ncbi:MAG: hypothetical protein IT367_19450 [Candidatus Hydrogenedentes bacterium]|nr:hypothetical protein [Candidatus Hydrogenedentota bacterium]
MNAHEHIKSTTLVTDVYGCWPRFHDAEVIRIVLDRGTADGGPSLAMDIKTFEMTSEVDAKGHFVLRNEKVVSLRFLSVTELELCDFNRQNVLLELEISRISGDGGDSRFEVSLNASYGVAGSFRCREIKVEEICDCSDGESAQS